MRRRATPRTFMTVDRPFPPADPFVVGWVAGFLDGESSMTFRDTPLVRVANCHLPTLMQLCTWYGGSVSRKSVKPGNARPAYEWCVSGDKARSLLGAMLGHLREKRQQAEAILGEPKNPRGIALTEADWRRRIDLRRQLSAMKRPVFHPPA